MRKSLEDIQHMVKKIPYPGDLPKELEPFHYYIQDGGHAIMCVLEVHIAEAQESDLDDFEVPVPVKYVLATGYRFVDNHVVVSAPYDPALGLDVAESYDEY